MNWMVANRGLVVGVGGALIAIALVGWRFSAWQGSREAKAGAELAEAIELQSRPISSEGSARPGQETFASKEEREKAVIAALEKVRADHRSTTAAQTALAEIGFHKLKGADAAGARKTLKRSSPARRRAIRFARSRKSRSDMRSRRRIVSTRRKRRSRNCAIWSCPRAPTTSWPASPWSRASPMRGSSSSGWRRNIPRTSTSCARRTSGWNWRRFRRWPLDRRRRPLRNRSRRRRRARSRKGRNRSDPARVARLFLDAPRAWRAAIAPAGPARPAILRGRDAAHRPAGKAAFLSHGDGDAGAR